MKPAPFDFLRAASLDQVWDVFDHDDDAKLLAGGQSLVPLMTLRFASPSVVVDITGLSELTGVSATDTTLRIGALTRHAEIERNPLISEHAGLLAHAATWVAHPQIRNRGTIGGSVAHADAAAEFPAALLALDAVIVVRSRDGERRIGVDGFFKSYFTTALRPGEVITAIEVPLRTPHTSWGFAEYALRRGDYGIGGAAAVAECDDDGVCVGVRAGLLAASAAPCVADRLTDELVGHRPDPSRITKAVQGAIGCVSPGANVHGTAEYRRAVIEEMLHRALTEALIDRRIA